MAPFDGAEEQKRQKVNRNVYVISQKEARPASPVVRKKFDKSMVEVRSRSRLNDRLELVSEEDKEDEEEEDDCIQPSQLVDVQLPTQSKTSSAPLNYFVGQHPATAQRLITTPYHAKNKQTNSMSKVKNKR